MLMKRLPLIVLLIFLGCAQVPVKVVPTMPVEQLKEAYVGRLVLNILVAPADEGLLAPPVAGLAIPPNTIIVEGQMVEGKVIIRTPAVLGHELWHILAFQYPELFWDPDKLNKVFELGK